MATIEKRVAQACDAVRELVGTNIRTRREKQGMTRRDLAQKCGVHEDVLQKIELAQRLPMVETLVLVSIALEVPVRDLFQPVKG